MCLPEHLNKDQNGQHGPVHEGKDPYRQCLRIRHTYKLLDSVENGDHLRHWAAHLASVGEESEQQGRVLEELENTVYGRASSYTLSLTSSLLKAPSMVQAVWRPWRGLIALDKLFLHPCAWPMEAAPSSDAGRSEAFCKSFEFICWLWFSQAVHQIQFC